MGRAVVEVSLGLIETLIFDDQVRIVEMRGFRSAPGVTPEMTVEMVIDGPVLPQVNGLGLPRPVKCTVTERRRSIAFEAIDDDQAAWRRVREWVQRGGDFAQPFET